MGIQVTEAAMDVIRNRSKKQPLNRVLRLALRSNEKLAFEWSLPGPHDQVVLSNGQDLLHIDRRIAEWLDGAVIDARPSGRLVLMRL